MALKNKPIRFCDSSGKEELGLVQLERQDSYIIRVFRDEIRYSIFPKKTSIKITEVFPFEFSRIEWLQGWANDPELVIKMTKEDYDANWAGMLYECKHDHYWAENQGLCSFYFYTGPSTGFGGRTFTLKMKDGTTKDLIGPWSSGYHNTNNWFPECTCCTIEVGGRERPARYAGHIRTDLARIILPAKVFLYNKDNTICPSLSPEKVEKPMLDKKKSKS